MDPNPVTSSRRRRKAITKTAAVTVPFRAADHRRNAKENTGYIRAMLADGDARAVPIALVTVADVTKLADCIYVLHAFHKKSKTGIETPKEEIDLAKKRCKELVQSLRRS
jgi:phage-related protein